MSTTGLCVALFVSMIFFVQTVFSVAGFFMGFDLDSGDGMNVDSDAGIQGTPDGFFGLTMHDILSFKGFLHFLFGFSWSWACFGLTNIFTTLLATFIGIFCVVILALLYKKLSSLETESTNENLDALVSRVASVYSLFDDGSFLGSVYYNGDYREILMFSDDEVAVGDQVIVDKIEDGAVIVRKPKF